MKLGGFYCKSGQKIASNMGGIYPKFYQDMFQPFLNDLPARPFSEVKITLEDNNDGEQGTGDDHEPAIAPAGDGADADPADFGAAFLDALPAPPEHVDTTTDESTSEGDVDIDEGPISQRLKRRDGSKPPPSYSGHDGGDEESSDEDVGGESEEGNVAEQAGGAQAASSSNTNPPRQTFSCSICARDFQTAKSLCTHFKTHNYTPVDLASSGLTKCGCCAQICCLIPNKLPDGSGGNGTSMFFNHLSSRNDPLHKAHKEKITPKAECTDAIAKALLHAAPGTPGANLTHADNRGVSAATRTRRLAWAPAVPGAAACSAAAVAALRNATGVSLAWNSPSGVADTINLNTTPAADYDLSICDSVSIECLKRLHLQSQDFPDSKEYRAKIRSVLEFGMKAFGGNPNAPGTEDGARGAIFVVASTILVTCRPSGSPRYTTDQMVERAATIAHSPDGFLALWKELALSAARSCSVPCSRLQPKYEVDKLH